MPQASKTIQVYSQKSDKEKDHDIRRTSRNCKVSRWWTEPTPARQIRCPGSNPGARQLRGSSHPRWRHGSQHCSRRSSTRTALSTTPPLALWNPPSSGKNLVIMKATMGYVSGTLGGGSVLFAVVPSQTTVPTTGTELVPLNAMLGFPRGVGRAFQGSTLVAAPSILRPSFVMGAWVGTTATPPANELDIVDGGIVVPQGAVLCMQGLAGAGTSPLVLFAMTWEEVDA